MIFDYHSHLGWDNRENRFLCDEILTDSREYGIDKRMVSALYGYSIREQNDVVANLVKNNPNKLYACAVLNPKERNCLDEAERIANSGIFKAFELDSLEHSYFPNNQSNIDEIIEIATFYKMPVNVFTGWGSRTAAAQWAVYAKRHPNMRMVLLHMGDTDSGYSCPDLIKQHDNIWVEMSCVYELPILRRAFQKIDKEKILFGSHYPHKFTKCSIDVFDVLKLSDDILDHLYYKNAMSLLNL